MRLVLKWGGDLRPRGKKLRKPGGVGGNDVLTVEDKRNFGIHKSPPDISVQRPNDENGTQGKWGSKRGEFAAIVTKRCIGDRRSTQKKRGGGGSP